MAKMTEESIMQLLRSHDDDDLLPEDEQSRSDEAIERLHKASLEGKYSFINVIVLSVVLIACAVYFISMTSGDPYSDREIEISPKRLIDGSFTAELSRRYYSTIAYPEETDKLYEKLTSFYGITGEGRKSAEELRNEFDITPPDEHSRPTTTTKRQHTENEVTTTTAASEEDTQTTTALTDPTDNSTIFSRTTTTATTTIEFDPLNPWATTTTTTGSTTNNSAPPATATTTAAPVTTPTQTCQTEPEPPPAELPDSSEDTPDSGADDSSAPDESGAPDDSSVPDDSSADVPADIGEDSP